MRWDPARWDPIRLYRYQEEGGGVYSYSYLYGEIHYGTHGTMKYGLNSGMNSGMKHGSSGGIVGEVYGGLQFLIDVFMATGAKKLGIGCLHRRIETTPEYDPHNKTAQGQKTQAVILAGR